MKVEHLHTLAKKKKRRARPHPNTATMLILWKEREKDEVRGKEREKREKTKKKHEKDSLQTSPEENRMKGETRRRSTGEKRDKKVVNFFFFLMCRALCVKEREQLSDFQFHWSGELLVPFFFAQTRHQRTQILELYKQRKNKQKSEVTRGSTSVFLKCNSPLRESDEALKKKKVQCQPRLIF